MKDTKSQWSEASWKIAYEEAVQLVTHWNGYKASPKLTPLFKGLCNKYPEYNPFLFMKANFPPYRECFTKKNGVWASVKYPTPSVLYGENSVKHYKRFLNQGLTYAVSNKEAIIRTFKNSLVVLKQCNVELDDFYRVWDFYKIDKVSPYVILMIPEMKKWLGIQLKKKEITLDEMKLIEEKEIVLYRYTGLVVELDKIMKGK